MEARGGGGGRGHLIRLPLDDGAAEGLDISMADMMDGPAGDDVMTGLESDMLPINLNLNLDDTDPNLVFGNGESTSGRDIQSNYPSSQQQQQDNQLQQPQRPQQSPLQHAQSQQGSDPQQLQQSIEASDFGQSRNSLSFNSLNDQSQRTSNESPGFGNAPGAGPLPKGYNTQQNSSNTNAPNTGGNSTLTEFTKRRNWPQRILDEIKDFLHILTPDGRILYASPSSKALTGHSAEEIVGKFIVNFIHPDDSGTFVREFHESIASGNPLRFFYRFRRADDTYTIFECHGHPHLSSDAYSSQQQNSNGGNGVGGSTNEPPRTVQTHCRGFFMMSRPYPTKNATLLDSFLEHKIENERLTRRITDLRREEQEEIEAQQRHLMKKQEGHGSVTPSDSRTESETPGSRSLASGQSADPDSSSMPPPAKPSTSNTALTQQNLDEANASSAPDSINDKMARYEGATHIETIEMLTGLRYRDGERSQGISTGDASPALIRGDAGIAIPADKEPRVGDKKKKIKVADEYVCTDCGTLDSPEWRKGPSGPKTLCNACGLRWAKKEKKRHPTAGGGGGPTTAGAFAGGQDGQITIQEPGSGEG
ncbi:blue light receptor [Agyrium rufum]|nr:blue light receptor [Agyrium rufum]